MLRWMRIVLAFFVIAALTVFFLDFSETIPPSFSWIAKIQLVPALTGALSGAVLSLVILLVLLLVDLIWGRVYCSCVCPFGIMQDVISRVSRFFRPRKSKPGYCYLPPRKKTRRFFFLLTLVAILLSMFGITSFMIIVGLLDPYAQYGRIAVHLIYPLYACGNNLLVVLTRPLGNAKFYLVGHSMQSGTAFATACLSVLVTICFASRFGRLYCNAICPVGTFLGFLSRRALFRIHIDSEKCIECRQCVKACKSSCIDIDHNVIENDRCVLCFNCLNVCKKGAIRYSPLRKKEHAVKNEKTEISTQIQVDPAKRFFLMTAFIANFFGSLWGLVPKALAETIAPKPNDTAAQNNTHPTESSASPRHRVWHAVSPPGSLSLHHMTSRCTLCHLCVSKCPQHVIKPAFLDYGAAGLLLPVMKFSPEVFCNYDCTICGEVCPTGAILPLSLEEKHLTQTGHVVFFKDKCVVFTDETNCGACAEHCPTQAVSMIDYKGNLTIPETRKEFCVGCGACESICPVLPVQAIRVKGHLIHRNAELPPQERKVEAKMDDFGF